MTLDLVLVGFGNVARRFVTLLDEQRARLAREHDLSTRIVGIATRRHGQIFSSRGVDAISLAQSVAGGRSIENSGSSSTPFDFIRAAAKKSAPAVREGRLIVVETTTLDITRGQPAIAHVRGALAGGAHVVTANKGPAAFAYRSLTRAAARAQRRFLFEGSVMDGVPIFNLARETLPNITITGFRGVVNSTTNYILTALEQGRSFDEALREMQARGIAEADPSLDVDGWDAAAKASALANVLMGATLTPRLVERRGIRRDMAQRAVAAHRAGRRLRLVVRADRNGLTTLSDNRLTGPLAGVGRQSVAPVRSRVSARVTPEELPADDLLARLEGPQNALILDTDLLGEIAIVQRSGSLTQTAYALLADLITIGRDLRNGRATRRSPTTRALRDRNR